MNGLGGVARLATRDEIIVAIVATKGERQEVIEDRGRDDQAG